MQQLSDYDYELPSELIARQPAEKRDGSRLLVLDRSTGTIEHAHITDLPRYLRAGDTLVLNDTKVLPARLLGKRTATGGAWEGLYLGCDAEQRWQILSKTRGKLQPGESITLLPAHPADSAAEFHLTLLERDDDGGWFARPEREGDAVEILRQFGTVPLPPYIERELATSDDWQRYQTTYARSYGAVAAPTAGLHFTPELLEECRQQGVGQEFVTLHVGIGTFRPISVENLDEHRMHEEWCELDATVAQQLRNTRSQGGRIVAVGTTSVRTLESAARNGKIAAYQDQTDLFIRPPYTFQAVDVLLTNFHLPKSSLLVMISAFASYDLIRQAYAEAIAQQYRFFSYGDAMLIL
ncbi:S-adenosylmethionine:tRNA ribosyltransferase-isomerase [Symmachiella macrocystis]|uniref:S-adenosylmethionine:tRNA ribosyltransferase-isomerase n=1 Tax=Symmachiella macrocystis TaxID=2527985 RepID=A0A5C6BBP5_9PLAN|nr:tRNA preQ1(34) S-adenosylmethionine ribosyltransferase-isomerase QueA [Symmachiella macrocystis]TWU09493.1 S-adenosylmethionine:tRNA ribosyltransferase-isomerase [Symmachiella macrocystis]